MLWATILLVWELIGVDLSKAKDAGGNVGPIVTALKSPQAVPWVLLALVLYFLLKCSIEWAQCHLERRKIRFARADFISAWIVSLAAIVLYIGQALSRVQFADFLQRNLRLTLMFAMGFVAAFGAMPIVDLLFAWKRSDRITRVLGLLLPVLFFAILFFVTRVIMRHEEVPVNGGIILIGGMAGLPIVCGLRFLILRARDPDLSAQKPTRLPKK
jgi:hypothetical protein